METVTLLHTRWPKDEFIYNHSLRSIEDDVDDLTAEERGARYQTREKLLSGLWGTMRMLVGGSVRLARFDDPFNIPLAPGEHQECVMLEGRRVHLVVKGAIEAKKDFTTIERYRTNDGKVNKWDIGYVRMVGRDQPYGLRAETGNKVVKQLGEKRKPAYTHDGACIRVLGGATEQQRNILIHEATHVGWVVGCIGPRPYGNKEILPEKPGNASDQAVREIIAELKRRGGTGSLFVLRA